MPPSSLSRRRLESRLDDALRRRLTLVVAGAGFGKSTLLAAWADQVDCAWYSLTEDDAALGSLARGLVHALRLRLPALPAEISAVVEGMHGPDADEAGLSRGRELAGMICDVLADKLRRDLVLVVDDLHELGAARPAAALVEGLVREAPARLHIVLASRAEPPFRVERLRAQGQVLELAGAELAFTLDETAALIASELGEGDGLADPLQAATDGWPAAVRLAIEALRPVPAGERRAALRRVRDPGGPLFAYLATEVFEREPAAVRRLIRTVAPLDGFTPELLEALGLDGAAELLRSLSRRGLFLELHRSEVGWFSLSRLVREFVLEQHPLAPAELVDVHRTAAAWLESQDHVEEALRSLAAIGDDDEIARVLVDHGRPLLRAGATQAVLRAADLLTARGRDPDVEELVGAARQIQGDWEGALASFDRIAAGDGPLAPGLAWRIGIIHYFRGRLDEALALYARADLDGTAPRDEALLLAWRASAHWLRGEADECRANAERAFAVATAAGDSQSLAAAHTVLAMLAALDGDRGANDAHYLRALEHAERAGDLLQIIRIHANRASRHVEEGSYEDALAELETAVGLADLAGFASFLALALTNRGDAHFGLGRLEEAIRDLDSAKAIYQRISSWMLAYPLQKLGEVYRERGDFALARAAYEEAIALSEQGGDLQGLVPALAGLARVVVDEEPDEAARLADRAVAAGPGMAFVAALLAAGWVALARGRPAEAAEHAGRAAAEARSRRDRAGLAEALELRARTSVEPELEPERLEESRAIWREIHNPLGEARVELALARSRGGAAGVALAERAEICFRELGARRHAAAAAALRTQLEQRPQPALAIRTLGGFHVLRLGEPAQLAEWQSKKARDLLKILIARRGRPTPRDYLMEALWPDEDPLKLGNRLSVALATVRSVLDPQKRFDSEHFVSGEKGAVRLELANLELDVEEFLDGAAAGLALRGQGRGPEATEKLLATAALYGGSFLEESAYEDWASPLREEAQAVYVQMARALADDAAARGDADDAIRQFLRILECDAYDEPAHLGLVSTLVAAGRHGEARRFFRAYCAQMHELGVESAAFPSA